MTEAAQRRPGRTGDELQDLLARLVREGAHDVPEHADDGMFLAVVADDVETAVLGV